jgi:hypothetical protein
VFGVIHLDASSYRFVLKILLMNKLPIANEQNFSLTNRRLRIGVFAACLLAVFWGVFASHRELAAQLSNSLSFPDDPPVLTPQDRNMTKMRNENRQKKLIADSEKLLTLAIALNDEIKCRNTGSLTPAQLRKLSEMEKLAHNIKERMSTPVQPPQTAITPYAALN